LNSDVEVADRTADAPSERFRWLHQIEYRLGTHLEAATLEADDAEIELIAQRRNGPRIVKHSARRN
jgi:hypothetical protein